MDYDLQLYGAADEIVPLLIKGELDMAAIPANLAATLYQKTSGGIQAVAVNTLGVLYVVEQGDTVHSMADLKGRTILSTGKALPRSMCCAICLPPTALTRTRMWISSITARLLR